MGSFLEQEGQEEEEEGAREGGRKERNINKRVAHTCIPRNWEANAESAENSRPVRAIK